MKQYSAARAMPMTRDPTSKSELQAELQDPRIVRVHRMKKRVTRQAIHSTTARSRIHRAGASVTADDVVAGIPRMRGVIDAKLRMVEDVESFDAELKVPFAENLEMLDEGEIEIRSPWIIG